MIINYAFPPFEAWTADFIFQQDSNSLHNFFGVKACLNRNVPNIWIKKGGPVLRTPSSLELTSRHFSLWRYIEFKIYDKPIDSTEKSHRRSRVVISRINDKTSKKVCTNKKLLLIIVYNKRRDISKTIYASNNYSCYCTFASKKILKISRT